MKQSEFAIVAALARSSMKTPNNAIIHHIHRLANSLRTEYPEQAEALDQILKPNEAPNIIPILAKSL